MTIFLMHVRIFLLRVRYAGAIVIIGALLALPGEALMTLGRWIGSRSK